MNQRIYVRFQDFWHRTLESQGNWEDRVFSWKNRRERCGWGKKKKAFANFPTQQEKEFSYVVVTIRLKK